MACGHSHLFTCRLWSLSGYSGGDEWLCCSPCLKYLLPDALQEKNPVSPWSRAPTRPARRPVPCCAQGRGAGVVSFWRRRCSISTCSPRRPLPLSLQNSSGLTVPILSGICPHAGGIVSSDMPWLLRCSSVSGRPPYPSHALPGCSSPETVRRALCGRWDPGLPVGFLPLLPLPVRSSMASPCLLVQAVAVPSRGSVRCPRTDGPSCQLCRGSSEMPAAAGHCHFFGSQGPSSTEPPVGV